MTLEPEVNFDLLSRFYQAASEIDLAYCEMLNNGRSSLTGDRYEKLMDIFTEVEGFIECGGYESKARTLTLEELREKDKKEWES